MSSSFTGPASYSEHALPELFKARESFINGTNLTLKTPGHEKAGLDDFSGMCHGSGGCAVMTPNKSNLDQAGTQFDMDAATGYKRKPGCAGAHPTMQQAQDTHLYYFMEGQAKSLVKPEEQVQEYDAFLATCVPETD